MGQSNCSIVLGSEFKFKSDRINNTIRNSKKSAYFSQNFSPKKLATRHTLVNQLKRSGAIEICFSFGDRVSIFTPLKNF